MPGCNSLRCINVRHTVKKYFHHTFRRQMLQAQCIRDITVPRLDGKEIALPTVGSRFQTSYADLASFLIRHATKSLDNLHCHCISTSQLTKSTECLFPVTCQKTLASSLASEMIIRRRGSSPSASMFYHPPSPNTHPPEPHQNTFSLSFHCFTPQSCLPHSTLSRLCLLPSC